MVADDEEYDRLRATALKTAETILVARRRAERQLLAAKQTLERKTEELQQQREWFQVTLASIGDAVITTDIHGNVTFLNPVAESMTKWNGAQAIGVPLERVFRIINEDTQQPADNPVNEVLRTGQIHQLANHTALLTKDGSQVAIEDSAAAIRDSHEHVVGAVLVFHDVSARRRAEVALRASEARLRATVDQAAVGIAVTGLDKKFLEANQKFCDILGYSLDELRELTFTGITHPEDLAETQTRAQDLLAGKISQYVLEKRYAHKDGSVVWCRSTVTLLRDPSGEIKQLIGIIEDIADRKQAEQALQEQTRILELLNAAGTSIAAQLDLDTVAQTVTDAAVQLSGAKFGAFFYNASNQQGQPLALFTVSGAPRAAFERANLPRNNSLFKPRFRGEGIVRAADITQDPRCSTPSSYHGTPEAQLPVRSYLAVPVISRSGQIIGELFLGHPDANVFTQRTERLISSLAAQAATAIDNARLYEAAQREIASRLLAETALRETDQRKDEFLATLAHELRNPLAPIRQAALISKSAGTTEAQKSWSHDVIDRQVRHMALLLDDLLDISRITRGTLELRTEMVELAAVIDAAIETARPAIDAKQHRLSIELPSRNLSFSADPLRLAQILSNLLINAAKYTDPGGQIHLRASCDARLIRISVADSGIGIPAEAIGSVFAMFSQVKSSQDRSDGGLGIGLALAKGLADLHGGTIEAQSAGIGHGSEFTVLLPYQPAGAARAEPATDSSAAPAVRPRRVLIADDNRDAAESLAMLLQMEGHSVTVVHDGEQALLAFANMQPEVALLDIGMPKVSGYEVARQVRRGSPAQAVTLIALTGWGQDGDKAMARSAGFNYHFTKPIETDRLRAVLGAL